MADKQEKGFTNCSILNRDAWRRYPGFCLIVCVIFVLYAYVALKIVSPQIRNRSLQQFHLTSESYAEWFVLQPIPAMYNFANEVWIGNRPKKATPDFPKEMSFKHYYTWLNHYPLRVITFNWHRSMILTDEDYDFISLRSSYRSKILETGYFLNVKDGSVHMKRVY